MIFFFLLGYFKEWDSILKFWFLEISYPSTCSGLILLEKKRLLNEKTFTTIKYE